MNQPTKEYNTNRDIGGRAEIVMVTMGQIEDLGQRIGREFHPQRVILFGSHACGSAGKDSDVDLLVIMPFEGKSLQTSLRIMNRLEVHFPLDLIARQPQDVKRRYAEGDPLIREALDNGKVLYERNSSRQNGKTQPKLMR